MAMIYHINVLEDIKSLVRTGIFLTIEKLFPVKFNFNEEQKINPAGEIVFKDSLSQKAVDLSRNIPSLSVPLYSKLPENTQRFHIKVRFSDDPDVPIPFKGRIITTKIKGIGSYISLRQNEKVLASSQHGPIWTIYDVAKVRHFRSCLPLTQISTAENFCDVFNGECFLEILPFIHFLREVCRNKIYKSPPLRASYIIDDPNLHWPTYGYVNYKEITLHAQREKYHVSFATIPIDMCLAHRATAKIFRDNTTWISLLVHGNNHSKEELAVKYSIHKRKALLQQTIQRIERFEQKTRLRVCRVMVPPHGACSNEMLKELPKFGFESVCVSTGSLCHYNSDKSWTKTLGFFPSEVIEGCSVLPRSGLTGNIENTLLITAFLGKPIILRWHHKDLKEGVEVLDVLAKFINSFGDVIWTNMTGLSRKNYQWRMEGTICHIKPLANIISFQYPKNATEAIIDVSIKSNCLWTAKFTNGSLNEIPTGKLFTLNDAMRREIMLESNDIANTHEGSLRFKLFNSRHIVRRIFSIARDRLFL